MTMLAPATSARTFTQNLLLAAMVVGSVAAIALALLPIRVTLSHVVTDDMFYYLTAARNVVDGQIVSIDGRSATNGFHPLWMLICVAVVAVFRNSPDTAYRVAILLCAVLFVSTGWMLYRVVLRVASETVALVVGALFLCNYRLISVPLGGLETALYGFAIVVLIRWLSARGAEGLRSPRDAVVLGLLLAFTYWSRLDAVLLGVFVCLGMAFFTSGNPFAARLVHTSVAGLTSLIATLPWFVFSTHSVGALLPHSGAAIQLWSGYEADASLSSIANLAAFLRAKAGGMIEPLNDIANVLGVWPLTPNDGDGFRYVGVVIIFVVAAVAVMVVVRVFRVPALRPYGWIPMYSVAHTGYYVVFLRPEIRYLYPVFILMAFYQAIALQVLLDRSRDPQRSAAAASRVAVVMLSFAFLAGITAFQNGYGVGRFQLLHLGLYDLTPWLRTNTEPDAVIGGFNSGIVSNYSARRVVDLDGVMNEAAIDAIRTHTLSQYIDSQGIDYLADIDSEIHGFMDRFSGDPDWRSQWEVVHTATVSTPGSAHETRFTVLRRVNELVDDQAK